MTTTAPAGATLDAALADVSRLEAAAEKWAAEETRKAGELEAFESSAATRLIDESDAADQLTDEAARLRAGVALATRTRHTAEAQLIEARRQVLRVYGAELHGQATAMRAEADQRQAKTGEMLNALRSWEGCDFEPRVQMGDTSSSLVVRTRTRTELLRQRAAQLDGQADALERQAVDATPAQLAPAVATVTQKRAQHAAQAAV